jgi:V8-like Glu-specific endopeptidase
MKSLLSARCLPLLLAASFALLQPAMAASTGEAVDGTLFKATDSYVKSLLEKAGLSPRTMSDGDVAIDWHDGDRDYPGIVSFDRDQDGKIWNLRVAAVMPAKATQDLDPDLLAEFTNRWNRVEGMIMLYTGENGALIAAFDMAVEYGINPTELEANALRRFEQTLGRILQQLGEFASTYKSSRQKADTSQMPAQAVGLLELGDGGYCTASVVGADVILTAAHCLFDSNDKIVKAKRFRAGYADGRAIVEAGIRDQFVPQEFDMSRIFVSDGMEGHDWAFLRLDRAVGDKTGVLAIKPMSLQQLDGMVASQGYDLVRVGYGSSKKLTMQTGCNLAHVWDDNTYAHLCRIEPGDSGSPDLLVENGNYSIVGIDTSIIDIRDVKRANVAVSSAAFATALPEFLSHVPAADASESAGNRINR